MICKKTVPLLFLLILITYLLNWINGVCTMAEGEVRVEIVKPLKVELNIIAMSAYDVWTRVRYRGSMYPTRKVLASLSLSLPFYCHEHHPV